MKNAIKNLFSNPQQFLENVVNNINNIPTLAEKYGVPFINNAADAGCPGIMDPLGEQPKIQSEWGRGGANKDKTDRYNQFSKALEAIDKVYEGTFEKGDYLSLDIYGRVMFVNIANKQDDASAIMSLIADYASDNMQEVTYGKGHVNAEQIFAQYIKPEVDAYFQEINAINNTDNPTTISDDDIVGNFNTLKITIDIPYEHKTLGEDSNYNSDAAADNV